MSIFSFKEWRKNAKISRILATVLWVGAIIFAVMFVGQLCKWFRDALGTHRGNETLAIMAVVGVGLVTAVYYYRKNSLEKAAVIAAVAGAILCATAARLIHPNTQMGIAIDRVNAAESTIDTLHVLFPYETESNQRTITRLLPKLQEELAARRLEQEAARIRYQSKYHSSAERIYLLILGFGFLVIGFRYRRQKV